MSKYDRLGRMAWQGLVFFCFAACGMAAGQADDAFVRKQASGSTGLAVGASGRSYAVYVDAAPGADIAAPLQAALDQVRPYGGRVVLPPGQYRLTSGVSLGGTLRKFPHGGVRGVTLDGNGASLIWEGPDQGAIVDLPGPWNCRVENLKIQGARGRPWRNVVGLRYGDGVQRGVHIGKNNVFENVTIENVGVGVEVGGLFGPDLVGGTFLNLNVFVSRIGVRLMGHNVTGMVFVNPQVSAFEEAGFQIKAFPARRIRTSPADLVPGLTAARQPAVLLDADGQQEIFQKDLPA